MEYLEVCGLHWKDSKKYTVIACLKTYHMHSISQKGPLIKTTRTSLNYQHTAKMTRLLNVKRYEHNLYAVLLRK